MDNYTQNANATTGPYADNCFRAALFLWWMPPLVSGMILGGGGMMVFFFILHESSELDSCLNRLLGVANKTIDEQAEAAATYERARIAEHELAGSGSGSDRADQQQHMHAGSVNADNVSEAETAIDDCTSPKDHDYESNAPLMGRSEDAKPADRFAIAGGAKAPPARPAISGMTPEQIRELSHTFMKSSMFTFLLVPFIIFIACLLTNTIWFCEYTTIYPARLVYMLWVLVPGYLAWNYCVIFMWGQVLAVILGREKEKWNDGAMLTRVQWRLAFLVQPILTMACLLGHKLYRDGAERIYRYAVSVMESRITRNQYRPRQRKDGDTMLLPLN